MAYLIFYPVGCPEWFSYFHLICEMAVVIILSAIGFKIVRKTLYFKMSGLDVVRGSFSDSIAWSWRTSRWSGCSASAWSCYCCLNWSPPERQDDVKGDPMMQNNDLYYSPQLRGRIFRVVCYPLLQFCLLRWMGRPTRFCRGVKIVIPECRMLSQRQWQSLGKGEASDCSTFQPDIRHGWMTGHLNLRYIPRKLSQIF